MNFSKIYSELKRRNVFKVATAYAIAGWLIIQICATTFPYLRLPDWLITAVIIFVLIGFPLALIFAWAFELTPDGLRKTEEVSKSESVTPKTGKRLNYWIIGILVLTILFMGIERIWFAGTPTDENTQGNNAPAYKASVAVLPFVDMSPGQDQEWFSDGLTDDILNSLTRIRDLKVIARTSSFAFKNKNLPIQIIADSLNVEYILEGSVRRLTDTNDLRVTAQLIRAEDAAHIWSHNYNRNVEDLFQIQDEIAGSIASALDIYLDPEEREMLTHSGTQNIEAYEAFLRGKELFYEAHHSDIEKLWEANSYFEKATEFDPQFSPAYFYHHDLWAHRLFGGVDNHFTVSTEGDSISIAYAQSRLMDDLNNALATTDNDYQRLYTQATQIFFSNNWNGLLRVVDRLFQESYNLNPATMSSGSYLQDGFLVLGKHQEFDKLLDRMMDLDPLGGMTNLTYKIRINIGLGDFDAVDSIITDAQSRSSNYQAFTEPNLFIDALRNPEAMAADDQPFQNKMFAYYVLGDKKGSDSLFAMYKASPQYNMPSMYRRNQLLNYHIFQQPEQADSVAAEMDKQPLGLYQLIGVVSQFGGTLIFDLDATPNFKNHLLQAGLDIEKMNKERKFRRLLEKRLATAEQAQARVAE